MATNFMLHRFIFPNPGYSVKKDCETHVADVIVAPDKHLKSDTVYYFRDFPRSVSIVFKDYCLYNDESAFGTHRYCVINNPNKLPLKDFYFVILETEKRRNIGLIYTLSKV